MAGKRFIPMVLTLDGREVPIELGRRLKQAESELASFNKRVKSSLSSTTGFTPSDIKAFQSAGGSSAIREQQRAARESQRLAASELREIERIHAAKVRMAEQEARARTRYEAQAAREVQRINAETRRQAEQQEKLRERAAKTLADVQTREARRAANEAIRSMGDVKRSQEQATRSTSSLSGAGEFLAIIFGINIVAAFHRVVGLLKSLVAGAFEAATSFDSLVRGLTAVSGSTEVANKQLRDLRQIAKEPGIGFREAIQGAVRMEAVGISIEKTHKILREFANTIALTGGGRAELDRVTVQIGQMSSKSKILAQDLKPIIEASPAVGRALKDAFGTVDSEELQKLGLTTEVFLDILLAKLEDLPRVTGGARNAWDNLQDAWDQALVTLGKPLLEPLANGLNKLTDALNNNQYRFERWGQSVMDILRGVQRVGDSFIGGYILWLAEMTIKLDGLINPLRQLLHVLELLGATQRAPDYGTPTISPYVNTPEHIEEQKKWAEENPYIVNPDYAAQLGVQPKERTSVAGLLQKMKEFGIKGLTANRGEKEAKDSAINQEARAQMKLAELDLRAAERSYREATTTAQREYDLRSISLKDFTDKQIAAEVAVRNSKLEGLKKEKAAAEGLTSKTAAQAAVRNAALREIEEKRKDIISESNIKIQQLIDAEGAKEIESRQATSKALVDMMESVDQRRVAAFEAMAELELISQEALENERLKIQTDAFTVRRKVLEDEQRAVQTNVEEEKRVSNDLRKLYQEEAAVKEASVRRIDAARQKDLESARRRAASLRELQLATQQGEIELNNERLDRLERLGAHPDFIKAARADQDVRAEIARHADARRDIINAQAGAELSRMKPEDRAAAEEAFRNRMLLEETRHQERMREIRERPLVEYMARLKELGDTIGGIFADAITSGENFFERMSSGFKRMFLSIVSNYIQSRVSNYIQSLFNPMAGGPGGTPMFNPSGGGGSGGGGGFNLGGIFNLFRGGGAQNIASGFRQGGFFGGLRNLFGLGRTAAAAAPAAAATGTSGLLGASAGGAAALGALLAGGGGTAAAAAGTGMAAAGAGGAAAAGGASGGAFAGVIPFLTNPFTLAAAGAAIGGFLLWRKFRRGTEKKLREAIRATYGVDIKDNKVLTQIKEIGEQAFGRGNVGNHISEVIALGPVKELIEQYAESTGQDMSKVNPAKGLDQETDPRNRHVEREGGGAPASPNTSPSFNRAATSPAPQVSFAGTASASTSSGSSGGSSGARGSQGSSPLEPILATLIAANTQAMNALVNKVRAWRPGEVLGAGVEENPRAISKTMEDEADSNQGFKDSFFRKAGFAR